MSIPFINDKYLHLPAICDDNTSGFITYGDLKKMSMIWRDRMLGNKCLVLLKIYNDVESVAALLGALAAGQVVALVDPEIPDMRTDELKQKYLPKWIIDCKKDIFIENTYNNLEKTMFVNDLNYLLLSTSGSTGSPKFVRLSQNNLMSNADDIANVLQIDCKSTAFCHLPIHYSYGFSVLSSHLSRVARIVLTNKSLLDKEFWHKLEFTESTHLPGVPYHFEMMKRLGLGRLPLNHVRMLTQAGGHLDGQIREDLWKLMEHKGGKFCVMYGQTEASPRMATLAHGDFPHAPDSVGTALPSGEFVIQDENGTPLSAGETGEIVYRGPNVMLGYAETAKDLESGDLLSGVLLTGDMGSLDNAARLTISGRSKRFAKVLGVRINLDEIERALMQHMPVAVIADASRVKIFFEAMGDADQVSARQKQVREILKANFSLSPSFCSMHPITAIPMNDRNKINYPELELLS